MNAVTSLLVEGAANSTLGRPAFYFDFAPVLARSQGFKRNPERLQLLSEHCVRRLAPDDIMLPEESGFFLVVLSAETNAADALAQDINIALLELFFGTDALSKGLSSICRRATIQEIEKKGIAIPPSPRRNRLAPIRYADLEKIEPDPLARLAASGAKEYEGLSTAFMPLINLRRDTTALFLCGAMRRQQDAILFGGAALEGISADHRVSLDEAILEYSLGFARGMAPTRSASAIVAPVHYETLAWSRGRQPYQSALRAADIAANPFLLLRIEGVPPGTPAARLAEIVAMLRPFVRRVFLELPDPDRSLISSGLLGVAGFMTALPQDATLASASRAMNGLVQLANAQQAVACVTDVGGVQHLALARSAGVRFAACTAREHLLTRVPSLESQGASRAA